MNALSDMIFYEKYRPQQFEDLILAHKGKLLSYLENPKVMPSFIFYSSQPGTGKTSTAKLISSTLNCDTLSINASDERGIDTIREKISIFARSMSSNPDSKRCIHLDEADGLTKPSQESMRNLMEEYSENCFFVLTVNDLSKIIEPLQSRCQVISFEHPNKADIIARLEYIAVEEGLDLDLEQLVELHYPDMRKMINALQDMKITGSSFEASNNVRFSEFLDFIYKKDVNAVYECVYAGDFDMPAFNNWYFHKLFAGYSNSNQEKTRQIALRLADNERCWALQCNKEIIFLSNVMEIMKVL